MKVNRDGFKLVKPVKKVKSNIYIQAVLKQQNKFEGFLRGKSQQEINEKAREFKVKPYGTLICKTFDF